MFINNQELSIPNPKKDGDLRLKYNLANVFSADARVHEIGFVNTTKAPELLAMFSLALRDLSSALAYLQYNSATASKKKRERRAIVVLEVMPAKLAEKKLSSNDTNREAVIELDPEYSALCDVENEIEAAYVYVREKLHTMESNLNAAKKALDAATHTSGINQNLVQNLGEAPSVTTHGNMQIGKARYGSGQ